MDSLKADLIMANKYKLISTPLSIEDLFSWVTVILNDIEDEQELEEGLFSQKMLDRLPILLRYTSCHPDDQAGASVINRLFEYLPTETLEEHAEWSRSFWLEVGLEAEKYNKTEQPQQFLHWNQLCSGLIHELQRLDTDADLLPALCFVGVLTYCGHEYNDKERQLLEKYEDLIDNPPDQFEEYPPLSVAQGVLSETISAYREESESDSPPSSVSDYEEEPAPVMFKVVPKPVAQPSPYQPIIVDQLTVIKAESKENRLTTRPFLPVHSTLAAQFNAITHNSRFTVGIDVDETLLHIDFETKQIYLRPHIDRFIARLKELKESGLDMRICIWSHAIKSLQQYLPTELTELCDLIIYREDAMAKKLVTPQGEGQKNIYAYTANLSPSAQIKPTDLVVFVDDRADNYQGLTYLKPIKPYRTPETQQDDCCLIDFLRFIDEQLIELLALEPSEIERVIQKSIELKEPWWEILMKEPVRLAVTTRKSKDGLYAVKRRAVVDDR